MVHMEDHGRGNLLDLEEARVDMIIARIAAGLVVHKPGIHRRMVNALVEMESVAQASPYNGAVTLGKARMGGMEYGAFGITESGEGKGRWCRKSPRRLKMSVSNREKLLTIRHK